MKRFTHLFFLMFAGMLGAIPLHSWGQSTLNMPQFGKQEVEVSDEIIFYDMKGEEDISSATANNSCSSIVFKPAVAGKSIQISFEYFDAYTDGTSYPAFLKVYNGIFDVDNKFVYPTTTGGVTVNHRFPYDANQLDSLDIGKKGTALTNKTYVSSDPTGCLSVSYIYKYAGKCKGWKAKVSCVTVSDMEIKASGSSYEQVPAGAYAGKQFVNLLSFYVNAEGIMKPDHLTSFSFTLPVNEGVVDPLQLKLYSGAQPNFKGMTPIEATLTESAGVYTFTFDKQLISGTNQFSVVGDFKSDAPFDAKIKVLATGLKTAGYPKGVSGFSIADASVLTVARVVLMPSEAKTYEVSGPITFYDDGGEDGNITEQFVGQATFKPSTQGKKVMVDFTKLDLFNTSSTGLNDVLKIYYGDKVDESQLAVTLLKEKTAIIKSIAENGALTVTLKSTTGVPKSGFEAVVSEFTPQPMFVEEFAVSQYTDGTVVAGDINQPILSFNIQTDHTESALNATKFSFTTEGTFAKLSKAALFFTGKNSAFGTSTKLGEVTITENTFVINAGTPFSLFEGDNYFWLAYNIDENAQTGEKIDAGINMVTLSGEEKTIENGHPEGIRSVKNEFISQEGSYTKTVNGEWGYSYVCSSAYSSNDHKVTFTPKSSDMILEMAFQKFKLYFPYSSTPAFAIYSGTEVNTEKCIWKVTSSNKSPELNKVIRPMEGDASLTIVYNANGISSSSAYGWDAVVREYKSKPMVMNSINVFQASMEVLKAGTKNQEIIGFSIQTEGDQSPLKLNEVLLNLKGCQDKVDKVYVYTSGSDSLLTNTNPITEAVPVAESGNLNLTLTMPLTLPEGKSYYWVTYDINDEVLSEQVIDAALTSVKIGTENKTPVNGDPVGERVTKNTYDLQSGDNGTVVIGNEALMFYDNGGVDGQTPKNFKGTITFAPKEEGKVIKLVFKKWSISGNDKMLFYYGGEKKDKEDVKYSNTSDAKPLISKSEDGKLTVYFECPSYGYVSDGWEIEVSSYTLEDLSLGEVNVTAVNNSFLLKGMTDVPMLRIDVEVKGDKGAFDITRLNFDAVSSTAGAIKVATVYSTDTISNFVAHNGYSESLSAAPYVFNGSYKVIERGVYKFWLTYDIASDAKLNDKVEAKLLGMTANGVETQLQNTPLASATIKEGFKGTYTIGGNGDYQTITAAVNAMKDGVDGPVVFELENGEYNELVEIPEIPGASAVNTITFKSKSGKYQDVKLYYNRYSEPAYSDDKMFYEYGVFTVAGADYLTLDGVTVTTTDLTFPSIIHIKNASRHVAIKNCHIYTDMTTNYSADINLVYQYALNKANQNNDYFTLENCLLEGGYNGARISGTTMVALPKQIGSRIINNIFRNQGAKGIYIPGEIDLSIKGNVIENTKSDKTDFNALDVTSYENLTISENVINLATKNYAAAIYLRNVNGTVEKQGYVVNNEINVMCVGASASSGIKLTSPSSYLNIAYNTIRMRGEAAGSVAMYVNDVMNNTFIQNNIFQNEAKEGYVYRLYKSTCLVGTTYSNNMLYTDSQTLFARVGSDELKFDAWKTQSGETGSYLEQTAFLSDGVLEPAEVGNLSHALPLAYVTTDLNGVARNAENPTMGAYEFADQSNAPVMTEGYPAISGVKHNEAIVTVKSSLSGKVFLLTKKSEEAAPTVDEVKAGDSIDVRKEKEVEILLEGLNNQTNYKCYIVLQNLRGIASEVLGSDVFTTSYLPTEVSTFENVEVVAGEDFEDGTASFSGFTVETITDGIETSKKAAKLEADGGLITLTNSTAGLKLTGFYLKSDAETSMTVYGKDAVETTVTLASTDSKWIFTNLKNRREITGLMLSSTGNVSIDNFSGEPLPVTFMVEGGTVNEGENITLSADIQGGVLPYVYSWTNAKKEELSTEKSYTFAPQHVGEYILTVKDAWNNQMSGKALVKVTGNAHTATFDDLYLESESHWRGDEENDEMYNVFYSGSYAFDNVLMKDYDTWALFGYSNETSTDYTGKLSEQFRSAVGHGVNNSANYAVAYASNYMGITKITVTNRAEGDSIRGCYITNSAWAKDAILTGDGVLAGDMGFETGDWFKLTAKGKNAEGKVSTVDFYLADYRSDNEADHYCLDSWQWMDLSALGKVKEVSFDLSSSKNNSYGMTTPSYFCMDDFNGARNITEAEVQTVNLGESSISLAQFFTFESVDASIEYRIEDSFNEVVAGAVIKNGLLVINGKTDKASLDLVVSAVQQGKKQFVHIPVTVDSAVSINETAYAGSVSVYPVPVVDKLNVVTDMEDYLIEVISVNGTRVQMQDNNSGNASVNVGGLESGVYLLKMSNERSSFIKRFAKVN